MRPRVPFAPMNAHLPWILFVVITSLFMTSGCALSYRHQSFSQTETVRDVAVDIQGDQGSFGFGTVFDFRAVRFIGPFVTTSEEFKLSDDRGGRSSDEANRKTRYFRVDAPIASFWSRTAGFGLEYPGFLRHRSSVDLWIGADSDLKTERTSYWFDVGIGYYQYNLVAVRLFAGWGARPFRGVSRYFAEQTFVDTQIQGFGGGIEVTLAAGEYALDFVQLLMDIDEAQDKIFSGQSPSE